MLQANWNYNHAPDLLINDSRYTNTRTQLTSNDPSEYFAAVYTNLQNIALNDFYNFDS